MRVILQRVSRASVRVENKIVGRLKKPGILHSSVLPMRTARPNWRKWRIRPLTCAFLMAKNPRLRLMRPFSLLVNSRSTEMRKKGRRPSWSKAAPGAVSEPLFEAFVQKLRDTGLRVETGVFGADMQVELVNDGPVTLILDSETL